MQIPNSSHLAAPGGLPVQEDAPPVRALGDTRFALNGILTQYAEHSLRRSCVDRVRVLLDLLPDSIPSPKVCPDEDGAVLFAWRHGSALLAGVDDGGVAIVENAGTAQAVYHEECSLSDSARIIVAALQRPFLATQTGTATGHPHGCEAAKPVASNERNHPQDTRGGSIARGDEARGLLLTTVFIDLLGQVDGFIAEQGEADFYTAPAHAMKALLVGREVPEYLTRALAKFAAENSIPVSAAGWQKDGGTSNG